MKAIKGLCGLLLLAALPLAAHAGDTPGSYTNYKFDPSVSTLNAVDFGITVKTDPGYRANVYWSNQFSLVGTSSGGYTGMQSNGGSKRMFLFSIWDATQSKPGSAGSYCVSFGGEGVGQSCRMAHEWQQGHTYRFHVAYEGNQWLGVTVTDLTTNGSFKLGSIRTAANGISPNGMVNWTEYFEWSSADSNCFNQPYSSAEFHLPVGNGGSAVASISGTSLSKTCTSYSEVSKTASGSLQRNAIGNSLRGAVIGAGDRCIDAQGGATSNVPAITYNCTGGANQAWVHGVDHTLRLENNLCLDVANSNSAPGAPVIVYSCSGNPNQQWTQVGTQLRSDLSGLCLTASAAGVQLTTQKCSATATNQSWRLPLPQN
ncbi:RICIN domain-containing protein [Dyella tabacisoli]|nr:ricin-type beta-trefoil lectin domain protein [Dyella tabacisoli]